MWQEQRDRFAQLDPTTRENVLEHRQDAARARLAGDLTRSVIWNALAELAALPPQSNDTERAIYATIAQALGHRDVSDADANATIVRNLLLDILAGQFDELHRDARGTP